MDRVNQGGKHTLTSSPRIIVTGLIAQHPTLGGVTWDHLMAKVERSALMAYISATGMLNPVIMVQVGTQVSGTIEKLFADFNSTVVPGQQLAQLDQASFRAKVLQAETNLDNARADVKNAMANVHNMRASIDTARADVASRSAQRERARVAIVDTKYPLLL
jgi:HlyD family secretion protein